MPTPGYNSYSLFTDTDKGTDTTQTYSFPSGLTNPALLVVVCGEKGPYSASSTATYDGNSMTLIGGGTNNEQDIMAFIITNPSTGSNTLYIDFINTLENVYIWCIALDNVDQSSPTVSFALQADNTDTYNIAYSNTNADSLTIAAIEYVRTGDTLAVSGASMTNIAISEATGGNASGVGYAARGDTSSHNYTWTTTADQEAELMVIEIAAGPTAFIPKVIFL